MAQPAAPSGSRRRGAAAPVLIILVITLVVMIAGVLVVLFPEGTGVPGLTASPPALGSPQTQD